MLIRVLGDTKQSRFVDDVSVESLLATTSLEGIDREKAQTIVNFSEVLYYLFIVLH